jgi:hypothetical protein
MGQRVSVRGELKPIGEGAAKASLNRAKGVIPIQSRAEDPKPSDLAMARLKVG